MRDASVRDEASVGWLVAEAADEFVECLQRGEHPRLEAFQAKYAQVASVLPQVFEALRLMQSVASPSSPYLHHDESESTTPSVLGEYRIVREIGRGGMGIVLEAVHVSLGQRVALKVLPLAATFDSKQRARFHLETRAAAALDHPNIVPLQEAGCDRGVHYYAMPFVAGAALSDVILARRAQRSDASASKSVDRFRNTADCDSELARIGFQAADALAHAHANGVLHRDIKPANLLLDSSGKLWITDFGLARFQSEPGLTTTGDLLGTLRYMSPEQALAKRCGVDHRTDVYSLGATLYELATLEPVFPGGDRQELLRQIAFKDPIRPRRLNPKLSADFEAVLLRALQKDPDRRYATARELAEDLRRLRYGKPIAAREATSAQAIRRNLFLGGAIAFVAVLLSLAAWGVASRDGKTIEVRAAWSTSARNSANANIAERTARGIELNRHGTIELHRLSAVDGKFAALDRWFRESGRDALARHGILVYGIHYEVSTSPGESAGSLYCWLSCPRGANRERLWDAVQGDPDCTPLFGQDGSNRPLQSVTIDTLLPLSLDDSSNDDPP